MLVSLWDPSFGPDENVDGLLVGPSDDDDDDDDDDDNDAASEGYRELLSSPIVEKCQPHLRHDDDDDDDDVGDVDDDAEGAGADFFGQTQRWSYQV